MTSCDIPGLEDIEDITKTYDFNGLTRDEKPKDLPPKAKKLSKLKAKNGIKTNIPEYSKPTADSIIPGTQKIFVKTWGCSHNNSDGEYMAGQLASFGYHITGIIIIIIMTIIMSNIIIIQWHSQGGARGAIIVKSKNYPAYFLRLKACQIPGWNPCNLHTGDYANKNCFHANRHNRSIVLLGK